MWADRGCGSRLHAVMLIHAGLPVRYYTFGESSGTDVKIATLISQAFNLPYEYICVITSDITKGWDKICLQVVQQCDGMSPIHAIPRVIAIQTRPLLRYT